MTLEDTEDDNEDVADDNDVVRPATMTDDEIFCDAGLQVLILLCN